MKNSADLGGCYPPRPLASVDNTLLYLQNSSYPTQPHSIIANYVLMLSQFNECENECKINNVKMNVKFYLQDLKK